jgi:hypothetical protein
MRICELELISDVRFAGHQHFSFHENTPVETECSLAMPVVLSRFELLK